MVKTAGALFGLLLLVAACSGPKPLPKGPPPEYEDEPAVSADAGVAPSPEASLGPNG